MKLPRLDQSNRLLGAVLRFAKGRPVRAMLLAGLLAWPSAAALAQPVSGNISPYFIEIDGDLWPSNALPLVDWVKDALPNTDPASTNDSIAVGIIPGVSGAVGGTGHWWGVRIVDGIAGGDQDIFIKGGKENDTTTWNIGPGSVGSSKYDITQAYLANNQSFLYFGMERRGNNGTTAFDFEFNQAAPAPGSTYIPTRKTNDILFTFEMNGSAQSGSAVPHYYVWNGVAYIETNPPPSSLVSVINQTSIPAAPWGYVDSKGNWVLGSIDKFEFAEASVLLTQAFPGFTACGNTAYVQVRTRSSATDTSDLKDTTKIFEFKFGGATAVAEAYPNCNAQFFFVGTNSTDSVGASGNLNYSWTFQAPAGIALDTTSSSFPTGTVTVVFPTGWSGDPVVVTNQLTVTDSYGCTATNTATVMVFPELTASFIKTQNRTNLTAILNGAAPGATSLQWQLQTGLSTWADIANATNAVLNYSTFEKDSWNVFLIHDNFTLGTGTAYYEGYLYEVNLRLHATRVEANGLTCEAWSAPQTVRKLVAVDP